MASLNRCEFIGNLTKDPEMRYTQSGKAVCSFTVAVNEKTKDRESTQYIPIVTWQKLAEICGEYLRKGSLVFIEGRWNTRSWEDRDGNKRYTTEIVAQNMQMLGKLEGRREEPRREVEPDRDWVPEDDIPF